MAPRISVRPAATMSAARLSSIAPKRAACATSRSPASCGHVDEAGGRGVGDRGDDDEVAQPAQQVLGEAARVLAGLDDLVDDARRPRRRRATANASTTSSSSVSGVKPSRSVASLWVTPAGAGAAEQLVEHGQRVARRPRPGAYDEGQRGRLDRHALLAAELGEVVAEQPRRDQPEGVVVGARADGRQHLVGLGRGEDEPQVRRRLLDQLEQGVEALRGDHVGLVDDVDLVLVAHRREERLLAQVTRVVDATVGRRVDLDDVDLEPGPPRASPPGSLSHSPHGSEIGARAQLSARARIRAEVVLPQPRGPENR